MSDLRTPDAAATGGSVAAQIAAKVRSDDYLELPIPRWRGFVIARYGPAKMKVIREQQRKPSLQRAIAVLVDACVEVMLQPPGGGDLITAASDLGKDTPVRFDGNLADLFQLDGDSPQQILIQMFQVDTAIYAAAQKVINWTTGEGLDQTPDEDIEVLAEGEASAAT